MRERREEGGWQARGRQTGKEGSHCKEGRQGRQRRDGERRDRWSGSPRRCTPGSRGGGCKRRCQLLVLFLDGVAGALAPVAQAEGLQLRDALPRPTLSYALADKQLLGLRRQVEALVPALGAGINASTTRPTGPVHLTAMHLGRYALPASTLQSQPAESSMSVNSRSRPPRMSNE